MKKIVLFLFLLSIPFVSYGFTDEQKNQLHLAISGLSSYNEQLEILSQLPVSKNIDREYINSLKKEIITKNLKAILIDTKQDYENRKDIYYKYFLVLQSVDNEASLSPYYFLKLKNKIHENEVYLKAFIYIFYQIKNNIQQDKEYYNNYTKFLELQMQEKIPLLLLDDETFTFLKQNKYNYLSKNDLERLKKYILKNKIGPESKMFTFFKNYKSFLENINNNSIFLQNNFTQKLQEKNLSCEVNSASLFASYILQTPITEQQVFENISVVGEKIKKVGSRYIWGNPYKEFVGNIHGKQTKFLNQITGYGVYAHPISYALGKLGIKNKVTNFETDVIIKSLLENEPVMFWYLLKNKSGILATNPVTWYTKENNKIQGYIGEHTGVIVGVSLYNNGSINEVYFYEGKSMDIQIMKFENLKYQASFFNMMITKE